MEQLIRRRWREDAPLGEGISKRDLASTQSAPRHVLESVVLLRGSEGARCTGVKLAAGGGTKTLNW